jgi:hypothetical protein
MSDAASDHKPVTAEELAEIAHLDREATPGPWTTDGGQVVETEHQIDPEADPGERSDVCECLNYGRDPGPFRTGTARFIAASRDLMPRLAHDLAAERETSKRLADRNLDLGRELEALRAAVRAHRAAARPAGRHHLQRDLDLWAAAKVTP